LLEPKLPGERAQLLTQRERNPRSFRHWQL